jgi:hypothetical protein
VSSQRASWAAAAAALLFVAALQVHRVDDSDTWWHLASGRLIAMTHTVVHTDPFSFTAPGAPWINRQWLFDLVAYAVWWVGGSTALVLWAGVLFLAGFICLYALARRRLPAWAAAVLVFLAAQAAVERFMIRPEAVTFAGLGIYLLVLDRRPLSTAWIVGLVVLQVLWANAHALSVLGIVVLLLELGGSAASLWLPLPAGWRAAGRRESDDLRRLALATVCAVGAECATPFGITGALFPLRLFGVLRGVDVTSAAVIEHRPPTFAALSAPADVGFLALLGLAILAAAISHRRWRLSHLGLAVAFTLLAMLARHNIALLVPGLVPIIADGLQAPVLSFERQLSRRPFARAALGLGLALLFLCTTAAVVTGSYYGWAHLTRSFGLGESALLFPQEAVAFIDAHARDARLFNDDLFGGYLLWRRQPPQPVFIDGRMQVYPAAVFTDYARAVADPSTFPDLAARYGITAAMLNHSAPGRLELAAAISRLPGWRVAYLDGGAIVLLADGKPPGPPEGLKTPPPAVRVAGLAAWLERLIAPLRFPTEDALAYYERGRAVLFLYGTPGEPVARADFEAALRLWPDFEPARIALGTIASSPTAASP